MGREPQDRVRWKSRNIRYWKKLSIPVLCLMILIIGSSTVVSASTPTPSIVKTKVLEPRDSFIHGFVYKASYLWASTRTSPCRILKIDPNTLEYERIILTIGLG